MTFAVIKTGGKQYKVSEGDILKIEKIKGDHKEGGKIVFDEVLMTDDGRGTKIGTPTVKGAKVEAELQEDGRDRKITVRRFMAKSRHYKKKGHRQPYFKVKITKIS